MADEGMYDVFSGVRRIDMREADTDSKTTAKTTVETQASSSGASSGSAAADVADAAAQHTECEKSKRQEEPKKIRDVLDDWGYMYDPEGLLTWNEFMSHKYGKDSSERGGDASGEGREKSVSGESRKNEDGDSGDKPEENNASAPDQKTSTIGPEDIDWVLFSN